MRPAKVQTHDRAKAVKWLGVSLATITPLAKRRGSDQAE